MAIVPTTYDPIRAFKFQVTMYGGPDGELTLGFQKVSGLKTSTDVVEYREGNMFINKMKLPGLTNYEPITLTRGAGPNKIASQLTEWRYEVAGFRNPSVNHDGIAISPADGREAVGSGNFRRSVAINVFDKGIDTTSGQPDKSYVVYKAWPSEVNISDLNAEASEVLIESIVLQHEGLDIFGAKRVEQGNR